MFPADAEKHYSSKAEIARRLSVSDTAVGHWFRQGFIPYDRQCQIQVETDGALLADKAHASPQSSEEKAA